MNAGFTAEAEYVSLSSAAQKAVWLGRIFLFAKQLKKNGTIPIHADNRAAIKMAKITLADFARNILILI